MNRLDEIYERSIGAAEFARGYLGYLSDVLGALDENAIAGFVDVLLDARDRGARIFFLGNGGSAATASHFANDIAIGTRSMEKPFRAISLTDNVAVMTAIANDDGYDLVFVQQLQTSMLPGDVVVGISASGNSANVVGAIDYANDNGGYTVSLTGFDGGLISKKANLNVHIPTNPGEYGPAEDGHMVIDHLVGAYLVRRIKTAKA